MRTIEGWGLSPRPELLRNTFWIDLALLAHTSCCLIAGCDFFLESVLDVSIISLSKRAKIFRRRDDRFMHF